MAIKNQSRLFFLSFFVIWGLFLNGLPTKGQAVITSDDIFGGFAFRQVTQKKVAFRNVGKVKRLKKQVLTTAKRIQKQAVVVASVKPKRVKAKEQNPEVVNDPGLNRKPKEEVSRIFSGVGEYYIKQQNWDKAIEFFRSSAELDSKNKIAVLGLSESLTRKGDSELERNGDASRLFYEEAVELNEKNADAYAGLGQLYDLADDKDRALANYKKALELDPDLTELYAPIGILQFQKNEMTEADKNLSKALAVSPDNPETQFFLGLIRFNQERNAEALTAFRKAIQLDPTHAEAHYYLAETLDRLKKTPESIAAYKKAIELNPTYSEAWFDLGVAYYNNKNYQEAIDAYKQTVRLNNINGEAQANLGDAYLQLDKYDEAIGAYRIAAALLKTDRDVYSKFGYVSGLLANLPGRSGYWNTAIDNLNKAIEYNPEFIDYTNLGWAYYNSAKVDSLAGNKAAAQQKMQKAKEALEKSIKLNPKFAATFLDLGITQSDLGEYKAAIETLKQADSLRADWIPAINELGLAYRANNDSENAAKQFKRVISINNNFAVGHYNYAESQIKLNNMKEAKKSYQELLRIGRKDLSSRLERMTGGKIKG